MAAETMQKSAGIQQYYVTKIDELQVTYRYFICKEVHYYYLAFYVWEVSEHKETWSTKKWTQCWRWLYNHYIYIGVVYTILSLVVRQLREELQLLQEQGSHVGEVVKAMDKKKVLVKVYINYSDPGLVRPINLTFICIEYINDDNVTIEQQNITYNKSNGRERNRLSNKYI